MLAISSVTGVALRCLLIVIWFVFIYGILLVFAIGRVSSISTHWPMQGSARNIPTYS